MKVFSWSANALRFDTLSCKSPAAMQLSHFSSSKTFKSEVLRQAIAFSVLFWLACIVTSSEVDGTEKTRQDNTTTRHGSVKYNHLDRLGTIPQEDFQALLSLDTRPDTESNKLKQSRILLPL